MTEKWAIVTGASGGIGLDLARQLGQRGYHLVLVARSRDVLERLQLELASAAREVRVMALDLAKAGSCEALVKQTDAWGIIPEVLINNAGVGVHGPFLDSSLDVVIGMMELNTKALVHLSHQYGQRMRERQLGYMMQVASTAAFLPSPHYAVYSATKGFVLNFSRAFHFESSPFGLSSTALCPGPTATQFFTAAQHEPNRSFRSLMMRSEDVARQGLDALFAREEVCVAGLLNKITTTLPRLAPSKWVIKSTALFTK